MTVIDRGDGDLWGNAFAATLQVASVTMQGLAGTLLPAYLPRPHTDHLMQVLTDAVTEAEAGRDVRVVVEMPPGQGKSTVCSVLLPLYALARNPAWEIVLVSGEASLSTKWSRDCRRHITDGLIPGLSLAPESKAATEWETHAHGSLIARGVGGQITGRRARVMVIDDPTKNLTEAHSRQHREMLWETWQSVLKTRLRPGSVCVVVQTRWHSDDLAGRLIKADPDNWTRVKYEAIDMNGVPLLSPQTPETVEQATTRWTQTKAEVGTYVWSALYQQEPMPAGGSIFNPDWWQHWTSANVPPRDSGHIITSWDLAFGDTGDYCVGTVWQHADGAYWLRDMTRGRWPFTGQLARIRALAEAWPEAKAHIVEKAANGAAAVDALKREMPGVIALPPRGSKEVRAHAVTPLIEAGQVFVPTDAAWLTDFLTEMTGFPTGAPHDDIVDSVTQGLARLRTVGAGARVEVNPGVGSGQSRNWRM